MPESGALAAGYLYFWSPDPNLLDRALNSLNVKLGAARSSDSRVRIEAWYVRELLPRLEPSDHELVLGIQAFKVKDHIGKTRPWIGHGRIIVEGIRTPEELHRARGRGAGFLQGLLVARPAPSQGQGGT